MIKINQIKLPVTHSDEALKKKIIKMLKLNAKTGFTYRILKKSLDARKKPELFYTYSVAVEIEDTKNSEESIVKRAASSSVLIYKEKAPVGTPPHLRKRFQISALYAAVCSSFRSKWNSSAKYHVARP